MVRVSVVSKGARLSRIQLSSPNTPRTGVLWTTFTRVGSLNDTSATSATFSSTPRMEKSRSREMELPPWML